MDYRRSALHHFQGIPTVELTQVKTVGIVGAGVAGLATARSLIVQGIECTLFERSHILGGVWSDGYLNFGVQAQKELYEFPDWPLPGGGAQFYTGPDHPKVPCRFYRALWHYSAYSL